jgi:hypothetical protein
MAEGLLLHAAADLVDHDVAEPHHVEGVHDDLGRVEPRHERVVVAAVGVQRDPLDRRQPAVVAAGEPAGHCAAGAAVDDVE